MHTSGSTLQRLNQIVRRRVCIAHTYMHAASHLMRVVQRELTDIIGHTWMEMASFIIYSIDYMIRLVNYRISYIVVCVHMYNAVNLIFRKATCIHIALAGCTVYIVRRPNCSPWRNIGRALPLFGSPYIYATRVNDFSGLKIFTFLFFFFSFALSLVCACV